MACSKKTGVGGTIGCGGLVSYGGCSTGEDYQDYTPSNGNAGDKGIYSKHNWVLAHRWRNVFVDEAFLKAEKAMTDDFNVSDGLTFQKWSPPNFKIIGQWQRKLVLLLLLTL